jgi:Tfp pilus assembly protein PilN
MIRIDLARDEAAKKVKKSVLDQIEFLSSAKGKKIKSKIEEYSVLGITVAVSILPWLFMIQFESFMVSQNKRKIENLQRKIEVTKQEMSRLKPFQDELQSYEKQKKVVSERLVTVRKLLESRSTPVNILDAVGQSLPPKVWLMGVELSMSTKSVLQMTGQSFSNEEISDFIDKLSESIFISDVMLGDISTQYSADNFSLKDFYVSARPKGAGIPEPVKEPAKAEAKK